MPNIFVIGDAIANFILFLLPNRISTRIRQNISPRTILILRTNTKQCNGPRMTLFEGVFATLLFDMAIFGTNNILINGVIALFTSIQNSWDKPFANSDLATVQVTEFCNRLRIQQEPWIWEKEKGDYTSLNDFFSRSYAPSHFPSVGRGKVLSPACCTMQLYNNDTTMKSLLIKGCDYDIDKVGLPKMDLDKYSNNRVLIGYLSPKDYHRVHAPISGKVVHVKMEGIHSPSASVKFFGGKFNILNNNKRLVVVIEDQSDANDSNPLKVAIVVVGGVGVNTITYDGDLMDKIIEKGDELSTFRAGGSAFALFSTKPLEFVKPLMKACEEDLHVETLVGETLAI